MGMSVVVSYYPVILILGHVIFLAVVVMAEASRLVPWVV
jgi:hypothetical protein